MGFMVELDDEDLGTLQAAVENLRLANRTTEQLDAAWRIASKLEMIAKDAHAASRLHEDRKR